MREEASYLQERLEGNSSSLLLEERTRLLDSLRLELNKASHLNCKQLQLDIVVVDRKMLSQGSQVHSDFTAGVSLQGIGLKMEDSSA